MRRRRLGLTIALGLTGAVVALPVVAIAMHLDRNNQDSYTKVVPADNTGTYVITPRGAMQLFAWGIEVDSFPSDSPSLASSDIRRFVVVQRQPSDPSAYQLFDLSTGGTLVDWADSSRSPGQLALVPPVLGPGRYMLLVPLESMFGGETQSFFEIRGE